MIEENKMIDATDILRNPSDIQKITKKYVILNDQAGLRRKTFDNMIQAINLMSEHAWGCVNISTMYVESGALLMYALMEKIAH